VAGTERRDVDHDEFGELFATRSRPLRRTAYLLCGDWHRAEDLVQTTFAKVYAAWPRVREPQAMDAYLRRTLLHTHLDESRRRWRGEIATAELPERAHVDGTTGDTEDRLVLLAGLAQVPPRQRACLVLRFFDDCSVSETAKALGCSEGTVKSNTARGLTALRTALGPAFTEPALALRESTS
jgi:RNA polymerase sigma-70 factor (sigma-E family)